MLFIINFHSLIYFKREKVLSNIILNRFRYMIHFHWTLCTFPGTFHKGHSSKCRRVSAAAALPVDSF